MLDLTCEKCKTLIPVVENSRPMMEAYYNEDLDKIWDISVAKDFINKFQREAVIVDFAKIERIEYPQTDPHIEHVDISIPGIIDFEQKFLIDGNHRAAKAIRYGMPFYAFVLSEDEDKQCRREGRIILNDFKIEVSKTAMDSL